MPAVGFADCGHSSFLGRALRAGARVDLGRAGDEDTPTSRSIGRSSAPCSRSPRACPSPTPPQRQEVAGLTDPDGDLDRIRAEAAQLRAGLRYGTPPAQKPAVTEDERREQSPTSALWPRFVEARPPR